MEIRLYTITDSINTINKTLPTPTIFNGSIKDDGSVSIDSPTVLLATAALPAANYMYISAFGRYYYITSRRVVRTGLLEITGVSDPLMSFADQIMASPAIADRSADIDRTNAYIYDAQQPKQVNRVTTSYQLGVFDYAAGCIVLATIGGR